MFDRTQCLETKKTLIIKVPAALVWIPYPSVPDLGTGKP